MPSDKLSTNVVTRVSESFKKELNDLAASYGVDPAEVVRRVVGDAIRLWKVPGFMKRPRRRTTPK